MNGDSPRLIGWIVAVMGFVGSFLVRELMYVPWMLAVYVTGETGKPGNGTVILALSLLAVQWGVIGYIAARIAAPRIKAEGDKGEA